MYVCLYTLGRTWFEALRIDKATRVFGVRFNLLVLRRVVRERQRGSSCSPVAAETTPKNVKTRQRCP